MYHLIVQYCRKYSFTLAQNWSFWINLG